MRKTGKSILIATALIIIGAIIFMGGMAVNKWNFSRLSTRKMQTVEHEITEDFTKVSDLSPVDFVEQIGIFARFYGLQCGTTYAEPFRECLTGCRPITKRLLP